MYVADALSRPSLLLSVALAPPALFPTSLSYEEVAKSQQGCLSVDEMQKLSSLKVVSIPLSSEKSLLGDIFKSVFKPVTPKEFRWPILDHMHSTRSSRVVGLAFCLASDGL